MYLKKTIAFGLTALWLLSLFVLPITASPGNVYNWYCVRNKDHKQPEASEELRFVEQYHGYHVDKMHSDNNIEKMVYLTFDAGYENGNIAKILDILKEEKVPAAFFVLGNLVTSNTDLVKRMVSEGHTVCNHTYSHKDMTKFTKKQFIAELKKLETVYCEKIGVPISKFYRPPEGKFSADNVKWADEMGYKTIFWSFAYADWDNNKQPTPEAAKEKILSNMHNGAILLLHPTSGTNAMILKEVIKELKEQGYEFGTLESLTA